MSDIGVLLTFPGIATLLSFAQTAKHGSTSRITAIMGVALIPAFISLLWRMSLEFGWWTIACFFSTAFVVALINKSYVRANGFNALFSLQGVLGTFFILSSIFCWIL